MYLKQKFPVEILPQIYLTTCFAKENENTELENPLFKGFLTLVRKFLK
jgi:hypothetical protein